MRELSSWCIKALDMEQREGFLQVSAGCLTEAVREVELEVSETRLHRGGSQKHQQNLSQDSCSCSGRSPAYLPLHTTSLVKPARGTTLSAVATDALLQKAAEEPRDAEQ